MTNERPQAPPEQVLYAKVLYWGSLVGMAMLFVSFGIYIFEGLEHFIPVEQLPRYWSMPVGEFVRHSGMPTGWGWIQLLAYSDILNFLGIAVLAGLTILAYLLILPRLFATGPKIVGLVALAEVVVLALAASGLIAAGH